MKSLVMLLSVLLFSIATPAQTSDALTSEISFESADESPAVKPTKKQKAQVDKAFKKANKAKVQKNKKQKKHSKIVKPNKHGKKKNKKKS